MRVTVVALGSRGDTQPYMALGLGLQRAGHRVRLLAGDNFEGMVRAYGLDYAPAGVDVQAFMAGQAGLTEAGRNTISTIIRVVRESRPYMARMLVALEDACGDADAIIANLLGVSAYSLAEQRGVPFIFGLSIPLPGRTGTMPILISPLQRDLGVRLNRLSHDFFSGFLWMLLSGSMNGWRTKLGLTRLPRTGWPMETLKGRPVTRLYAHSPLVLPAPPDWPAHYHVTGTWFLDPPPGWQPPDELVRFIEAGLAPVYIGFGSMNGRDPKRTTERVLEAVRLSGQRAVLSCGWGGLTGEAAGDHVYITQDVPHDWLFPRMAAVVHHGGAGTTAAGLRAGIPSIIVPHFGDQPFWGRRVHALGAGPAPIPRGSLTAERLARAIQAAVTDSTMRRRAAEVGTRIRAEDGVGNAVRIFEAVVAEGR